MFISPKLSALSAPELAALCRWRGWLCLQGEPLWQPGNRIDFVGDNGVVSSNVHK